MSKISKKNARNRQKWGCLGCCPRSEPTVLDIDTATGIRDPSAMDAGKRAAKAMHEYLINKKQN